MAKPNLTLLAPEVLPAGAAPPVRAAPLEHRLAEAESRLVYLERALGDMVADLRGFMQGVSTQLGAIEENTNVLHRVDSLQRGLDDLEARLAAAGPQGPQLSRAKVAGAEFYENGNDQKGTG